MYKTEKRLARTVARYELAKLLPWLKSKFPKSLPVYHLIKNALREDWVWPGLEVIVDSYPHPSICICRSTEINGKLVSGQYVFIYAKTHQFFLNFVRNHFQEIANWKATATFIDVDTEVGQILLNHNQQFTQGYSGNNFGAGGSCFYFDLAVLSDRRDSLQIAEHFRVGNLSIEHLDHILANCATVDAKSKKVFFTHILTNDFPTAAIFDTIYERNSAPVAYCMYLPQGSIGAVYIHPDYQEQGLFKVVVAELLNALHEIGEISVWMESVHLNVPSQLEDLRDLGGRDYEDHMKCCIRYLPRIPRKIIPKKRVVQKAPIIHILVAADCTLSDMELDEGDFYADPGLSRKYGHDVEERQRVSANFEAEGRKLARKKKRAAKDAQGKSPRKSASWENEREDYIVDYFLSEDHCKVESA